MILEVKLQPQHLKAMALMTGTINVYTSTKIIHTLTNKLFITTVLSNRVSMATKLWKT